MPLVGRTAEALPLLEADSWSDRWPVSYTLYHGTLVLAELSEAYLCVESVDEAYTSAQTASSTSRAPNRNGATRRMP